MTTEPTDIELTLLFEAIYHRFHYDFRSYAQGSLKRRVERALTALNCETVSALQEKVLHDPAAFPALLPYLTVQVSEMVRDPEYFLAFRERIVPLLATYPSLKIWVAGCATGEEAYSFAILLREVGLLERSIIYATDIHLESLRVAEDGAYARDRVALFAANHEASGGTRPLSDYYTEAYGAVLLDRSLRKNIVFSDHSLATDNVFAEVHVISCRNVLIYFDASLQRRATALFRDSLRRGGFLGLGTRETLRFSPHAASFTEHSPDERWYRKIP